MSSYPPPPNPATPPTPPTPPSPWHVQQDHSWSLPSVIIGAVAIATCMLLLSPVAWWMGSRAIQESLADPGRYRDPGTARAGRILGIVGTLLLAVAIIGFVLLVAFTTVVEVTAGS